MDGSSPLKWLFVILLTVYKVTLISGNLNGVEEMEFNCDDVLEDKPLPYRVQVGRNYLLEWGFDSEMITFHLHVKTKGWVGFGISRTGRMFPADVVVGWVNRGVGYLYEIHTVGQFIPPIENMPGWTLIDWSEDRWYTNLTVTKRFDVCYKKDEAKILNGTTVVIWNFSERDPMDNDPSKTPKGRRENAGHLSLLLLNPPPNHRVGANDEFKDYFSVKIRMNKYLVPTKKTALACTIVELPDIFNEKHHMIRWKPILNRMHDKLVLQSTVYACHSPILDRSLINKPYDCGDDIPERVPDCDKDIMIVWAIGGRAFNYPKDVGRMVGGSKDKRYLKIETLYNNPKMETDIVDNSGFRLFMTKKLRKHSAGILQVGVRSDDNQVLPPYDRTVLSRGFCQKECLDESLEKSGQKEIYVFGGLPHSHTIGKSMTTRLFREGKERAPILEDPYFDSYYQEIRLLKKERVIKKGDLLITDCHYNSTKRESVTYGGLDSTKERCLGFLLYYPVIDLSVCQSSVQWDDPTKFSRSEDYNWTSQSVRDKFLDTMLSTDIKNECYGFESMKFNERITKSPALGDYKLYETSQCQP